MTGERGPAASGARLLGDDYQHLLTWLHAAKLVHRSPEVTRVELEKHGAGNVDDVIVHYADRAGQYHQVKFVRNPAQEPLSADWFTDRGSAKKSPLERFYESWQRLTIEGSTPFMVLHTNRLPAPGDPIMACIDGATDLLVPKLTRAADGSDAGKVRAAWASHVGVEEAELLAMLGDLHVRAARVSVEELREHCRWVMDAAGLAHDFQAVDQGMLIARGWVEEGTRDVNADIVAAVVDQRQLRANRPRATVLIQQIDRDVYPELATESVDWVDAFPGDDPRQRRAPADPEIWQTRLASELAQAEQSVRAQDCREIRLTGAFRLATAVYAGSVFPDTRSYQIVVPGRSGDGQWTGDITSYGDRAPVDARCERQVVGQGAELAVGLSVSGSLEKAVLAHIQSAGLPIGEFAHITVPQLGTNALATPQAMRGWVQEVRDMLRDLAEEGWPRIHLFMFGPQVAAALLGHSWNRMPPTQLWDDLGPGRGYLPAFVIPG